MSNAMNNVQRAQAQRQAAKAKMPKPTPTPKMFPITYGELWLMFAAGVLAGITIAWLIEPIMRKFAA